MFQQKQQDFVMVTATAGNSFVNSAPCLEESFQEEDFVPPSLRVLSNHPGCLCPPSVAVLLYAQMCWACSPAPWALPVFLGNG